MATELNRREQDDQQAPAVNIGNASNPPPNPEDNERMSDNQFLSAGAEKYLREVASMEDYPDASDQEEMDRTIREEGKRD